MDIVESVVQFIGNAVPGLFPLPPDPNALGEMMPLLDQIPRDAQGIIGQAGDDPAAPLDSGDSAHKTGIAAFCNSAVDQGLLPLFEHDGIMVRHPSQEPWNNWKNCSRDQLMAYIAGCWRAKNTGIPARLLEKHATRFPPYTCQNTEADEPGTVKNPPVGDILAPHDVMALRIANGETGAYTDVLGQFSLQAAIEFADRSVDAEKNQLIVTSALCGRLDLYVQVHPNYRENILAYWAGWRKQRQIGEAFIQAVDKELERYAGRVKITLLPQNVIDFIKGIDLNEELKHFDPVHLVELKLRFSEALLKDQANLLVNVLKVGLLDAVQRLRSVGATIDQIARAFSNIDEVPNAIRAALGAAGYPANAISAAMKAAFPGIPHVDQALTPHSDQAAVPHTDIAPSHQDIAPVHTDFGLHVDATVPHVDFSAFGSHTDEGGHTDGGHTDVEVTPHIDQISTPHADMGATAHIDIPPQGHIDTP